MYGHFRTKMQIKHTPGRYWKEAPVPLLSQDAADLNEKILTPNLACIHFVLGPLAAFYSSVSCLTPTGRLRGLFSQF
jgi:hypothetical protein